MKRVMLFVCAMLMLFGTVGMANAYLFNEGTDAGVLTNTAVYVPSLWEIDGIAGTLPGSDVDVYAFDVYHPGDFSATTVTGFDPQLFLFDSSGHALWGSDDIQGTPYDANSRIEQYVTPGTYYLAITRFNMDPVDSSGNKLFKDWFDGLQVPAEGAGPLASWTGPVENATGGAYQINTTIPNPEPATLLLVGSGLAGIAGFGRKTLLRRS